MKFTKYAGAVIVFYFLAANAWAGEQPTGPGKRIEPRQIQLKNGNVQAAKKEALKQRHMDIRRAPPAIPLVAEVQADGSIVIRHRALPEAGQAQGRKPQ